MLVDDVLEDHVIDDSEKKRLVSIAEGFLNEMGDDTGRIYELYGCFIKTIRWWKYGRI